MLLSLPSVSAITDGHAPPQAIGSACEGGVDGGDWLKGRLDLPGDRVPAMTLANVGLLVQCWSMTNIQKRSPHKGYGYIYVSMLVCWSFWASFFSYPFFHENGPWEQPTDQQTNIRPKFLEILCAGKDLNVGCTRQHST